MARWRGRRPVDAPGWLWAYDPAAWPDQASWSAAVDEWFAARDLSDPAVWAVLASVMATPVYTEGPPGGPLA